MKVIAINGSPRKNGNTSILIETVLEELKKEGIDIEQIQLGGKEIHGCRGCLKCFEHQNKRCYFDDDMLNDLVRKIAGADGIIIGSPTYFANVNAETKAFIDRAGLVAIANEHMFKRKVGAAVVAVRRAGGTDAFDAINKFFLINQVVVPGANYWNMGFGFSEKEVRADEEGIDNMKVLGANMAWLMKKIGS